MEESLIVSKFDALVKSGLVHYEEDQEIIEHIDGGLKFRIIITSALAKKPTAETSGSSPEQKHESHTQPREGSDISTAGFEIGDVGSHHLLIANKFCFARPHLMLLTQDGRQRQYEPLYERDIEALWTVLTALGSKYVAFYNCGRDGGCSRLHKHMQLMPMPEDTFATFLDSESVREPDVPFEWFYRRLEPGDMAPGQVTKIYSDLLQQATEVGRGRSENAATAPPGAACPHSMILTSRWILVVPRRRAGILGGPGLNAIGMLGVLAVATMGEVDESVKMGLRDGLRKAGVSK